MQHFAKYVRQFRTEHTERQTANLISLMQEIIIIIVVVVVVMIIIIIITHVHTCLNVKDLRLDLNRNANVSIFCYS